MMITCLALRPPEALRWLPHSQRQQSLKRLALGLALHLRTLMFPLLGLLIVSMPQGAPCAAEASPQVAEAEESRVGVVRITGPARFKRVKLRVEGKDTPLAGELVAELEKVQNAKVKILGRMQGKTFEVQSYEILEVYRGIKPWVGILHGDPAQLALHPESGDDPSLAIKLAVAPRLRSRLVGWLGAKVWIHGRRAGNEGSQALKVLRFGVLRPAPSAAATEAPGAPSEPQTPKTDPAVPPVATEKP